MKVLCFVYMTFLLASCVYSHNKPALSLEKIGEYRTGIFGEGATEIVAYAPFPKRLFSVNAENKTIDVISLANPFAPSLSFSIDLSPYGKCANSVAVKNGIVAVAIEHEDKQSPGTLALFSTIGTCPFLKSFEIGTQPDMVTFSPNGRYILVANEGEPNKDYTVDPEGSISIVDIRWGLYNAIVKKVTFTDLNDQKEALLAKGIRIFGPNATVAQDFEPEYIAVSNDSKTAWVTLQENNAVAVISIKDAVVSDVFALGTKDHMNPENAFDASDKDDMIYSTTWPVNGLYMPDAIASFRIKGKQYYITANEGDARDYDGFSEEARVKDLTLDPVAFPYAASLQEKQNLGRLKVTKALGDEDGDGDFDKLYSYGGRSFSIWSESGEQIFESGDDLETITAACYPEEFNSDNDENESFDGRSDDKGPEPEGITVGRIGWKTYAFIGLERIGGIMVYDISKPTSPEFVTYENTRDFSGDPEKDEAGDLGPEGILFIPAFLSPNHTPLVVAAYEVSGSIAVFEVHTNHKCQMKQLHGCPHKNMK